MSQEKIMYQDPKAIAKYIISHTPIGLLDESLKNLKVLVKEEVLNSPEVIQELKKIQGRSFNSNFSPKFKNQSINISI